MRGGREIQILLAGRGHTGGDVVVDLPKKRILVTGDLLQPRLPADTADIYDRLTISLTRLYRTLDLERPH